jgi:ABC-type sugar transport system substrate-binding protein
MKKIFSVLLILMIFMGIGSSCAKDTIEIAIVPKALDNAIFLDTKAAAEAKAKELGIKIYWEGPTTSDAAAQVNVIESLIERQVDGILISCNDADALKDVIDRAVDAGIAVGCFDSDSPNSKRAFYCGTDNYAIGKLSAEYMMQYLPEGGKVAILTGVLGAVIGEAVCRMFRIRDRVAVGLAFGSAAHAVGTSRALEIGEIEGAMSSLAIAVSGLITVTVASFFVGFY